MQQAKMNIPQLYYSAFQSTVDVMNVYLGGLGRLQAYQIDAMQKMRTDPTELARQIESSASPEDMRWAQTDFAREQMERMTKYWGGLYSAAYQSQIEVIREAQAKALELTADMRQRLDSAPQGAEPMFAALRLVFDAAQSTYAAGIRATEEVERLTAAQTERVSSTAKTSGRRRAA